MSVLVLCLARFAASEWMKGKISSDTIDQLVYVEENVTVTPTEIPWEDTNDELWRYTIAGVIILLFVCGMIFVAWYLMKTRIDAKLTYLDIGEANKNSRQLPVTA